MGTYLQELKRLGVYDEATIIVTADHGEWELAEDMDHVVNPILSYKPSCSSESGTSQIGTGYTRSSKHVGNRMSAYADGG